MILTQTGELYSWGLGLSGQLGFTFDEIADNDLRLAKQVSSMIKSLPHKGKVEFGPPSYSLMD